MVCPSSSLHQAKPAKPGKLPLADRVRLSALLRAMTSGYAPNVLTIGYQALGGRRAGAAIIAAGRSFPARERNPARRRRDRGWPMVAVRRAGFCSA
jgi:hypothetical protein